MQTTSDLYQRIISGQNYWFEARLVIDGVGTFGEDQLFNISTNIEMFQNTPEVGSTASGEIEVRMLQPKVDIPKMAKLRPQVRIRNTNSISEWLAQGIYFIDTRETSKSEGGVEVLTIHGFDAMLKAEQMFASTRITGDSTDIQMVNEIARIMGVSVDQRTTELMTMGYTIPLPTGYTLREVLGYIASMYVGGFVMTDTGQLRLVSVLEIPPETNYLINENDDYITFGGDRILV